MAEEKNRPEGPSTKKIDEHWKEAVSKDKSGPDEKDQPLKEVNFNVFITGLMMDAFVALGEIENPLAKSKETNLPHAKFIIDILSLLRDKTKNNLTPEESKMLEQMLYELRMRYVDRAKKG